MWQELHGGDDDEHGHDQAQSPAGGPMFPNGGAPILDVRSTGGGAGAEHAVVGRRQVEAGLPQQQGAEKNDAGFGMGGDGEDGGQGADGADARLPLGNPQGAQQPRLGAGFGRAQEDAF